MASVSLVYLNLMILQSHPAEKKDLPDNTAQSNHLQVTLFERPMQAMVDYDVWSPNILNVPHTLVDGVAGDQGLILGVISVVGALHCL